MSYMTHTAVPVGLVVCDDSLEENLDVMLRLWIVLVINHNCKSQFTLNSDDLYDKKMVNQLYRLLSYQA